MAATTARTKQDVDNMTKEERLWDSLNYSYGRQREDSDRQYNQAASQADRQALSRGMQRSAYNAQNLANINQRKLEAQENSWNTQIADYENRLGQLEQQEAEADRWEREFAANREDTAWNKEFQQRQADTANNQWNLQFNAGREDTAWNQAFQQGQADLAREQWEREFGYNTESGDRQIAIQYAMSILQNGNMPSDDILARAGLSREDAQKMIAKKSGGGGGSGKGGTNTIEGAEGDKNYFNFGKDGVTSGTQGEELTDITLLMDQLWNEKQPAAAQQTGTSSNQGPLLWEKDPMSKGKKTNMYK